MENKAFCSWSLTVSLLLRVLINEAVKMLTLSQSSPDSAGRDGYRERERKVRWIGGKRHYPLLPHLALFFLCAVYYMKTTEDESGPNV